MLKDQGKVWAEVATEYNCYNLENDNLNTIAIITPNFKQLLTKDTFINETFKNKLSDLNAESCQYIDILSYFRGLQESNLRFLEILNSNTFCEDKDCSPTFSELKARADDIANISIRQLAFAVFSEAINHKSYLCNQENRSSVQAHIRASEILRLGEFFDRFQATGSLSYALNLNDYGNKRDIIALRNCQLNIDEIEDDMNRVYSKIKNEYFWVENNNDRNKETLKFLDDFMYDVVKAHIKEEINN